MRFSLPLLLCQSAIILVSFKGIVCPVQEFKFVIGNFGVVDSFSRVAFQGNNRMGQFILTKGGPRNSTSDQGRQQVVEMLDILPESIKREENCSRIVSFYVKGKPANYNIKFKSDEQAKVFALYKTMPSHFKLLWARLYINWRPVIMGYEYLVNGDIGFKIVDNKNNADIDERLVRQPYIFLRSEIKREIRISPPQTLYLSQIKGYVDYEIKFRSPANLDTFLEFFPEKIFDDEKTESYYFIPSTMPQDMPQPQDPLESNEMSESHDTSD